MKLEQCQREIDDRYYLIGSMPAHISETHHIKIMSLVPCEQMGTYFIQCNYVKEISPNKFDDAVLSEKLNIILSQYLFY